MPVGKKCSQPEELCQRAISFPCKQCVQANYRCDAEITGLNSLVDVMIAIVHLALKTYESVMQIQAFWLLL